MKVIAISSMALLSCFLQAQCIDFMHLVVDKMISSNHTNYVVTGHQKMCECKQVCVDDTQCQMASVQWRTSSFHCFISHAVSPLGALVTVNGSKAHTYYKTADGYYPHGKYFYRNNMVKEDRSTAKKMCVKEGGHLLYGVTDDEMTQVVEVFRNSKLEKSWMFIMKLLSMDRTTVTGLRMKNGDGNDADYMGQIPLVTHKLPDLFNNYNVFLGYSTNGDLQYDITSEKLPFICQKKLV